MLPFDDDIPSTPVMSLTWDEIQPWIVSKISHTNRRGRTFQSRDIASLINRTVIMVDPHGVWLDRLNDMHGRIAIQYLI